MLYETIKYELNKGIATLTFNRPEVFNSLNEQMHKELKSAITEIKKDKTIRVLIITGEGKAFCAGQDLNDRSVNDGDTKLDLGESIERKYNPLIKSLYNLEIPVICKINGVAAGAGANIAIACDIVLAAKSASFIQAFSKIGLIPDSGGTFTLPRLIGFNLASALMMTGDKLTADEALQHGMIYKVYDDSELNRQSIELGLKMAAMPTKALGLTKRILNQSYTNTISQQLDFEKEIQVESANSYDYNEGVKAFLEKRKPEFKGE